MFGGAQGSSAALGKSILGIPTTKLPTFSGRVPPRLEISIRRYTRSSLIGLRSILRC